MRASIVPRAAGPAPDGQGNDRHVHALQPASMAWRADYAYEDMFVASTLVA